jgi:nitroreductase
MASSENDILNCLYERGSVRSFQDRDVPAEVMEKILRAGKHAATGGNLQPVSIIEIRDKVMRDKLAEMCWQPFMASAPVHLLHCIDLRRLERWAALENAPFTAMKSFRHFWIAFQDVIICAQNICTAIDALELGSVYIGTIIEYLNDLKSLFKLPDGVIPVVLLCLGYPKKKPDISNKLDTDVFVHKGTYREMNDEKLLAAYKKKYPRQLFDLTDERMTVFSEVCERVCGKDKTDKWLAEIKEAGGFNPAQRYYGLHYRADYMCQNNSEMLETFERYGFTCFKPSPEFDFGEDE